MASGGAKAAQLALKTSRPIASTDLKQARLSVLKLYKQIQREAPEAWYYTRQYNHPLPEFRAAIKSKFLENNHLTDPRAIDRLVYEGNKHLEAVVKGFYSIEHVSNILFKEHIEPKPTDFLSKFLAGKD